MGTFKKHFKDSVKRMFLFSMFRNERQFLDAFNKHFSLSCDNLDFKILNDTSARLSVDFGDMKIDLDMKIKKHDEWYIVADVA